MYNFAHVESLETPDGRASPRTRFRDGERLRERLPVFAGVRLGVRIVRRRRA
jgi:hypothetical protein